MKRIRPLVLLGLLATLLAFAAAPATLARNTNRPPADVSLQELPAEARAVYARIRAGGPFQWDRDGVVFGNRERVLPAEPRGHYHEYTVRTPGSRTRGARRIVCGGRQTTPDACFYTDDHYQSFRRIRP